MGFIGFYWVIGLHQTLKGTQFALSKFLKISHFFVILKIYASVKLNIFFGTFDQAFQTKSRNPGEYSSSNESSDWRSF